MKWISVIFLLCGLFYYSTTAQANDGYVDSLEQLLQNQNQPEERAKTLMEIGNHYFLFSTDTAIFYFNQSYAISQKTKNNALKSEIAYKLSMALLYKDPAKSASYCLEAVEYAEMTNDHRLISYSRNMLGNVYRYGGDLEKAMDEYKYSLNVSQLANDSLQIARCYNNIGIVHMIKAEYDIGLEFWKQSLDIKLGLGEEEAAAATMSNIGLYYKDIGRYYEAKEYLEQALEINLRVKDYESVSFSYTIIGDMHWRMGNFKPAVDAYKTSLQYSDTMGSYFDKEDAYIGLARVLDSLDQHEEALHFYKLYTDLMLERNSESNARITKELTTKFETEKKQQENELLKGQNDAKDAQLALKEANNRNLWIGLGLAGLTLVLIILALFRVRQAKLEVEKQKHIVEEKNREITDSISYAKRLQEAILPTDKSIRKLLKESFVLYIPKDIVAGDFYWMEPLQTEEYPEAVLFAVADCTGHGVPGAMVSVVCHNALNRAVREFSLSRPGEILDKVTDLVIETFDEGTEEVKDGMDIALCLIDFKKKNLLFSGANNGIYHLSDDELNEIKPTKQPVGKYSNRFPFETHTIPFKEGDTFYLFTDGFADQFGGERGKKLKYKPFKQLISKNAHLAMGGQKAALALEFDNWMGAYEQIDDVCVAGIKV